MDHFLAVNKVFYLVSQEERQCKVGSHFKQSGDSTTHNMALAVKNESSKRPVPNGPNRSGNNSNYNYANTANGN